MYIYVRSEVRSMLKFRERERERERERNSILLVTIDISQYRNCGQLCLKMKRVVFLKFFKFYFYINSPQFREYHHHKLNTRGNQYFSYNPDILKLCKNMQEKGNNIFLI